MHQQDLRIKLQQRKQQLYKANHKIFDEEIAYFFDFLISDNFFQGAINELKAKTSSIKLEEWEAENFAFRKIAFPRKEIDRIRICFEIFEKCAKDTTQSLAMQHYGHNISQGNFDECVENFKDIFIEPIINYLNNQIDEGGSLLNILNMYKKKIEWFDKNALYEKYLNDTRHGEESLNQNLRKYLMDQGIEYPFSSPDSPSGKVDIVSLSQVEPLVLEIKLFDPSKGYNENSIKKGLNQAYDYSNDYNKEVGYLVVFNVSEYDLEIKTKADKYPHCIKKDGKSFFIIKIKLFPHKPTSKRVKRKKKQLTEAFLTG